MIATNRQTWNRNQDFIKEINMKYYDRYVNWIFDKNLSRGLEKFYTVALPSIIINLMIWIVVFSFIIMIWG